MVPNAQHWVVRPLLARALSACEDLSERQTAFGTLISLLLASRRDGTAPPFTFDIVKATSRLRTAIQAIVACSEDLRVVSTTDVVAAAWAALDAQVTELGQQGAVDELLAAALTKATRDALVVALAKIDEGTDGSACDCDCRRFLAALALRPLRWSDFSNFELYRLAHHLRRRVPFDDSEGYCSPCGEQLRSSLVHIASKPLFRDTLVQVCACVKATEVPVLCHEFLTYDHVMRAVASLSPRASHCLLVNMGQSAAQPWSCDRSLLDDAAAPHMDSYMMADVGCTRTVFASGPADAEMRSEQLKRVCCEMERVLDDVAFSCLHHHPRPAHFPAAVWRAVVAATLACALQGLPRLHPTPAVASVCQPQADLVFVPQLRMATDVDRPPMARSWVSLCSSMATPLSSDGRDGSTTTARALLSVHLAGAPRVWTFPRPSCEPSVVLQFAGTTMFVRPGTAFTVVCAGTCMTVDEKK